MTGADATRGVPEPDWDKALCVRSGDPEAWFPEHGHSSLAATRRPRAVCRACPIRADCLEWALANDERFGIWGGMTARQRRAEMKRRRAHRPVPGKGPGR